MARLVSISIATFLLVAAMATSKVNAEILNGRQVYQAAFSTRGAPQGVTLGQEESAYVLVEDGAEPTSASRPYIQKISAAGNLLPKLDIARLSYPDGTPGSFRGDGRESPLYIIASGDMLARSGNLLGLYDSAGRVKWAKELPSRQNTTFQLVTVRAGQGPDGRFLLYGGRSAGPSSPWLMNVKLDGSVAWIKQLGAAGSYEAYVGHSDGSGLLLWSRVIPINRPFKDEEEAYQLPHETLLDVVRADGSVAHRTVLKSVPTGPGAFFASGLITSRFDGDKTTAIYVSDFTGRKLAEVAWPFEGPMLKALPAGDGIVGLVVDRSEAWEKYFVASIAATGAVRWRTPSMKVVDFAGAANGDAFVLVQGDDAMGQPEDKWRVIRYSTP